MSEREPITAELRRYMEAYKPTVDGEHIEIARIGTIGYGGFVEHCDAIDAVHAALERENAELRERLAVLDNRSESMHDGWIRLPLDADGEYIRIGDVMEWVRYEDDDPTIVRNVAAVGADVFFAWSDEQGRYAQYEAHAYRHHHAPTVEDVLTKFGIDWEYEDNCEDRAALLKEYAKRLTLAGDAK